MCVDFHRKLCYFCRWQFRWWMRRCWLWLEIGPEIRSESIGTDGAVSYQAVWSEYIFRPWISNWFNDLLKFNNFPRFCTGRLMHDKMNDESMDRFNVDIIDSLEQAEISDLALVDFLHNVAFAMECIVANPPLYDRKHERHRDELYKLKIWNELCTVYHEKSMSFQCVLNQCRRKFVFCWEKRRLF